MINFGIFIVLTFFATSTMSYISMATPIGPWIAPTLVIFSLLLINLINKKLFSVNNQILQITGSSIGGILATALGFSLPTLYFLNPILFKSWLEQPIFFSSIVGFLSLSAGLFAFWIANTFEDKFIFQQNLNFPIGQMVYKMIFAQNQLAKAKYLIIGFISTIFFCIFQDLLILKKIIIPKSLSIFKTVTYFFLKIPEIKFDLFPTYWAIGYITGEIIAIPLLVGALSKIFIVDIINDQFFCNISNSGFMLAFCSGLILSGAIFGFYELAKNLADLFTKNLNKKLSFNKLTVWVVPIPIFQKNTIIFLKKFAAQYQIFSLSIFLLVNFLFLNYFNFSIFLQIYLLIFTFVATYQIVTIAGKIGLAQLGRFATFVMVPAMFIFNLDFIQLTIIATYVEICGGIATDLMFGRKIGQLSNISKIKLKQYQFFGILFSSLMSGVIFWLLITYFSLGSQELFAQRAQARALLIKAVIFDRYVLIIGFVFGLLLKKIKVNPMLTLGGLLMPINISLGLITGGLLNKFLKDKEKWEPYWSGVFASHSIWMIIQTLI